LVAANRDREDGLTKPDREPASRPLCKNPGVNGRCLICRGFDRRLVSRLEAVSALAGWGLGLKGLSKRSCVPRRGF
jgi:hypothetical protein